MQVPRQRSKAKDLKVGRNSGKKAKIENAKKLSQGGKSKERTRCEQREEKKENETKGRKQIIKEADD